MVFLLLVSLHFRQPLPFLILVGGNVGQGDIKMASASTPLSNDQANEPHFSPHSAAKLMIKAQISGRMIYSGISDVAFASVHSEKTHLKKLMMTMKIIIIITIIVKSQETTVFGGHQKLTSTLKLRPEK